MLGINSGFKKLKYKIATNIGVKANMKDLQKVIRNNEPLDIFNKNIIKNKFNALVMKSIAIDP